MQQVICDIYALCFSVLRCPIKIELQTDMWQLSLITSASELQNKESEFNCLLTLFHKCIVLRFIYL